MKKSTTVNRFVLHTLQRNITHLAVITRKTNIKLCILKRGAETGKEPQVCLKITFFECALSHPIKSCRRRRQEKNFRFGQTNMDFVSFGKSLVTRIEGAIS